MLLLLIYTIFMKMQGQDDDTCDCGDNGDLTSDVYGGLAF